ncbi:hypothetical protein WOLCODRAFT_155706 [Wolfiporia cocos MD-104 SS10]|uniref:Uncharacterized protein n=1 Tax=Wolfiporia cocos (strain MD-104) TaxID=742152 RepID=A0A2H3J8I6_WOLCO|nr:hypothetical protein WOLCODRAFT_155706 [Wolfiporia cocos MD-104 SS10]
MSALAMPERASCVPASLRRGPRRTGSEPAAHACADKGWLAGGAHARTVRRQARAARAVTEKSLEAGCADKLILQKTGVRVCATGRCSIDAASLPGASESMRAPGRAHDRSSIRPLGRPARSHSHATTPRPRKCTLRLIPPRDVCIHPHVPATESCRRDGILKSEQPTTRPASRCVPGSRLSIRSNSNSRWNSRAPLPLRQPARCPHKIPRWPLAHVGPGSSQRPRTHAPTPPRSIVPDPICHSSLPINLRARSRLYGPQ